MDTLPLCQAKSKQSGEQCKNFAVRNRKVCHIHGGKTPMHNKGPKTQEGKLKQKMGSWKHGFYSIESATERQAIQKFTRQAKTFLEQI